MQQRYGTRNGSRGLRLLALLLALALIGAACSSDDSSTDAATDFGDETALVEGASAPDLLAESPAEDLERSAPSLGNGGVQPSQVSQIPTRNIIFTADLTVAVTDVGAASSEATAIIEDFGGFLFGQDTVGFPDPRTTLTFKVEPRDFQAALAALGTVGEIRSQTVSADDVTERVVDLESRILTAEKSVERLQALLADSTDIKTIVDLENELLTRETDLETLRGSLRTIRDAVDLATITITLTEALSHPALNVNVTAYRGHDDAGSSCPGSFQLEVDEGDSDVTICYELFNAGDTPLTDFTLKDPVLDVDNNNVIVVFGNLEGTIEPGETIILAVEDSPNRRTRTQTNIKATPLDKDGNPVTGRTISNQSTIFIDVVDPGGLPGFGDGLSSGWELLQIIWAGVTVTTGFVTGLWPIILIAAAAWWWRRRRKIAAVTPPPVPPSEVGTDEEA